MQPSASARAITMPAADHSQGRLSVPWRRRLIAAAVFAPCAAVLLVATALRASPTGMGTHQQLGLPACGFKAIVDLPCATCGYTTAFARAAAGDLGLAMRVQPAGAILALVTAAAALVSGWAMCSGASLAPLASQLWRPRFLILGGALVLGAWVYKLLMVTYVLA